MASKCRSRRLPASSTVTRSRTAGSACVASIIARRRAEAGRQVIDGEQPVAGLAVARCHADRARRGVVGLCCGDLVAPEATATGVRAGATVHVRLVLLR